MIDLQTVSIVLTGIGLMIALIYYALQIRNQNKTRQTQLFMNLYDTYRSPEFRKQQLTIAQHEYTDFDDFWEKYGGPTNPDAWSTWFSVAAFYNGIGVLVKRKLISIDLVEELLSNIVERQWNSMGPILIDWREKIATDQVRKNELFHGFEYLAEEIRRRGTYTLGL